MAPLIFSLQTFVIFLFCVCGQTASYQALPWWVLCNLNSHLVVDRNKNTYCCSKVFKELSVCTLFADMWLLQLEVICYLQMQVIQDSNVLFNGAGVRFCWRQYCYIPQNRMWYCSYSKCLLQTIYLILKVWYVFWLTSMSYRYICTLSIELFSYIWSNIYLQKWTTVSMPTDFNSLELLLQILSDFMKE